MLSISVIGYDGDAWLDHCSVGLGTCREILIPNKAKPTSKEKEQDSQKCTYVCSMQAFIQVLFCNR